MGIDDIPVIDDMSPVDDDESESLEQPVMSPAPSTRAAAAMVIRVDDVKRMGDSRLWT
jgi:hypothetical protein